MIVGEKQVSEAEGCHLISCYITFNILQLKLSHSLLNITINVISVAFRL